MDNSITIKSFIKRLSVRFVLLILACSAIFYFFAPQYYFSFAPVVFIYFYVINIITYAILVRIQNLPSAKFFKSFMLITSVKFFGSILFSVIYLIFSDESRIPFMVIFIILYFLSLFQVVHDFLRFLNKKKAT
jgi:hypothetical protein